MPLSAYMAANIAASFVDPILMLMIIVWAVTGTVVSNIYIKDMIISDSKSMVERSVFEFFNVIIFIIAAFIIAFLFNKIFIDPFRLSIGAEPSPVMIRAFSIFVISFTINGIFGIFAK